MTQDRNKFRGLMNAVMKFWVSFLTSWEKFRFSERVLLHRVSNGSQHLM